MDRNGKGQFGPGGELDGPIGEDDVTLKISSSLVYEVFSK
jgi:hypothetical protein